MTQEQQYNQPIKTLFIFDLDGTLSSVGERLEELYPLHGRADWKAFYARGGEDFPNNPTFNVFKGLYAAGEDVKIFTGRGILSKVTTLNWLAKYGVEDFPLKDLCMRPEDCYDSEKMLKKKMIYPYKDRVKVIFESRSEMVYFWRNQGYICVQV